MGWKEEESEFRSAGFSDAEIASEQSRQRQDMMKNGFRGDEIDKYFGTVDPDMTPVKQLIESNLQKAANAPEGSKPPEQVDSIWHALEAGFEFSSGDMLWKAIRGKSVTPDMVLPEHAPRAYRIASQIGTLAGDFPAMVAGGIFGKFAGTAAGGAVGSAVPVVGTEAGGVVGGVLGEGAGAFALPEAIRSTLMQYYEKGEIKDFSDFWDRSSAVFLNTLKSGVTGAATLGVGKAAGVGLGAAGIEGTTAFLGKTSAEIATMVAVGKALDGKVPNAQEFIDAALIVGGLHLAIGTPAKLREIYAKTGIRPEEVAQDAQANPVIKQELLTNDSAIPKVYQDMADANAKAKTDILNSVAGEPAPYTYTPLDLSQSTEGKTFYHGTKADIEKLTDADVYGKSSVRNLYGEGLYLTDNPDVAKSYAQKKGQGPEGKVLSAELNKLNLVDLEKPLPPEVLKVLNDQIESLDGAKVSSDVPGKFAYSALKEAMVDAGLTKGDAIDVYGGINSELSDLGVDGLRHEGGNKVGGLGKHNVVILFEDHGVDAQGNIVGRLLRNKLKDVTQSQKSKTEAIASTPPAPKTELDAAREKVLSAIGEKSDTKVPFDLKQSAENIYTDFVNRLNPIRVAMEKTGKDISQLAADKNPVILARIASDAPAKAQYFLEKGVLDFETLGKVGKSFSEIVEPVKNDRSGLNAYLLSKRTLEVAPRGIKTPVDLESAQTVVKGDQPKFGKVQQDLVDFQNGTLKYLKDSGVLNETTFKSLVDAGKDYIPLKRVSEEGQSGKGSGSNPIRKLKGSDKQIQDPIKSIIENTELYLKVAERNRATRAFVDSIQEDPNQTLIEKVPRSMKPIEVSSEEIAKSLGVKDAEAITIFRPQEKTLAEDEFAVYRDGKREIYRTDEPGLANAIKVLDGNAPAQSMVFRLMRGLTTVKRLGITLAPDFMGRNIFKDQLTARINTKAGLIPGYDFFFAMGDIVKKNDVYYNWLKSGGANGAFIELSDRYFDPNIYRLNEQAGNFLDKTWNVLKTPFHYLEAAGQIAEQATRLAEFKRVSQGESSGPKLFEGGFAAREVTLDFQRVGAKVAAWNSITAFLNAQIQGVDKTVRSFKDNPGRTTAAGIASLTAPTVLLWWANHDDERVKEIPRWERDLHWIIPLDHWVKEERPGEAASLPPYLVRQTSSGTEINKGTIFRVPIPQEFGLIFKTLPERLLEKFFSDNPDAFKGFGETVQGMLAPNFLPDAAVPIVEQAFNTSLFTGNKLVSGHLEGQLPQYQYTDYTTDTAKALGKLVLPVPVISDLGPKGTPLSSPVVIENYIRSWSGSLGLYALQLADKGLQAAGVTPEPLKPASSLKDYPVIKAFIVRNPSAGAQSIQDFYQRYEDNQRALTSLKAKAKEGNISEVEKIQQNYAQYLQPLEGIKEALTNQGHLIQMINRNPEMKPEEKRQLIDGAYYGMIETAKQGMKSIQAFEDAVKSSQQELKKTGTH